MISSKVLDGYIPSTILAKDLCIPSSKLRYTTLEHIRFKRVLLIKLPSEVLKYIDGDYVPVLITKESDEEFDYILKISEKIKVGFWK